MNRKSKVAIAATAILATGALGLTLPSIAHDRAQGNENSTSQERRAMHEDRPDVSLSASITGIPSDVTSLRDAHRGAYFTVVLLDDSAIAAPSELPADALRRVSIRPSFQADGTVVAPEVVDGSISGSLGLHAPQTEGVVKLGLYPSDGSAPVMVTITTDANGNSTAISDGALTVSYSAEAAAQAPERGMRGGPGHRMGPQRGMHDHDHDHDVEAPNA